MVMQALRSGADSGFLKYILLGLLGAAVIGLALQDSQGVLGGGSVGGNDVASVNGETIGLQEFHRTIQRSLQQYQQFNITPQQAYKLGLVNEVLSGEIRRIFLQQEARNAGIAIGEKELQQRVAQVVKPYAQDNQSLQDTFEQFLRLRGYSEQSFIADVRKEVSTQIITDSITSAFLPETDLLARDLYLFQNHTRTIKMISFPHADFTTIEPATETQLQNLYEAQKNTQFTIPEKRSAQIALFDPNAIEIDVVIDPEDVARRYEENKESYKVGEQFVINQTITQDEAQANSIYESTQAGATLKDASVKLLGEEAKYIENIPFQTQAMLPVMVEALAGREISKIIPPFKSTLGYHIIQLNEILPPSYKSLGQVTTQIETELKAERSGDQVYELIQQLEERLQDGESYEQLAKDFSLKLFTIEGADRLAENWNNENIKPEDKNDFLEILFSLSEEEEFLSLEELTSGHIISVNLTDVTAESYQDFGTVKTQLSEQYLQDQREQENRQRVQKYQAELSTGGSTLESIAVEQKKEITTIANISLAGPIAAPLTDAARPSVFQTGLGEHDLVVLDDAYALIQVSDYSLPENNEEQVATLHTTLQAEAQDEALLLYLKHLSSQYSAQVNQPLLERAYNPPETP